jgi:DNA polymerase III subunit delta'
MDSTFRDSLENGQVAGAYLIEGSPGYFTSQTEAFIGSLFCAEHRLCGKCPPCMQIKAGYHPDILRITPSGQSIKVEDIADVGGWISQKPFEGDYKAVVISQADLMVEAAQNKLLKAIEEPPEHTVFLLGAVSRKNLLPTVLSRCIIIRMRREDSEDLIQSLQQRFDISTLIAAMLAKTAGYDAFAASDLFARKYLDTRETCIRAVRRLLEAKNRATSTTLDMLLQHSDHLGDAFLAMELYVRDIVVYQKTMSASLLYNGDKIVEIKSHAQALPSRKLVRILESLEAAHQKNKISTGILKKLLLESMLFEILEVVLT